MSRELLIGCGNNREKLIWKPGTDGKWGERYCLDMDDGCKQEGENFCQWDLNELPLPFDDNWFDEIHAYEVLEHVGQQGDYRTFFRQFEEFHRILAPGGIFCATVPMWDSSWAWGDPGHTRVITSGTLTFLSQKKYAEQVGVNPMSDYRRFYKADYDLMHLEEKGERMFFVLSAIK